MLLLLQFAILNKKKKERVQNAHTNSKADQVNINNVNRALEKQKNE